MTTATATPTKKPLNDWSREELLALPFREWGHESTYDSLLLLPTGEAHDSGWGIMAIIGIRDFQPIEIACGCCDDIEWKLPQMQTVGRFTIGQMRMDCLLKSGAFHPWERNSLFRVGAALSSVTVEVLTKSKD